MAVCWWLLASTRALSSLGRLSAKSVHSLIPLAHSLHDKFALSHAYNLYARTTYMHNAQHTHIHIYTHTHARTQITGSCDRHAAISQVHYRIRLVQVRRPAGVSIEFVYVCV